MDSLVSTEWLARELGASDLCIVDASYHLADTGRDAAAEHAAAHIPGAVFLDLAGLTEPGAAIENTMPSADRLAACLQAIGVGDGVRIVLYDDSAIRSATRGWFMLAMFGAGDVAILDGGLGKWKAEGRPLAQGRETRPPAHFTLTGSEARLRGKADVLANIAAPREQIVDARGAGRFTGADQETRPGIASGHIPGSRNVPYATLYDGAGRLRDKAELRAIFASAGVDLDRPVVTTCGSGMTACAVAFALHQLGKDDVALYDGSWTEWGANADTPKAVGPA